MVLTGSHIGIFSFQLMALCGKDLEVSLEVGFEVSTAHTRPSLFLPPTCTSDVNSWGISSTVTTNLLPAPCHDGHGLTLSTVSKEIKCFLF